MSTSFITPINPISPTSPLEPRELSTILPGEKSPLQSITSIITDIQNGKFVIIVDDADREDEGDLVMAAHLVTPAAINFVTRVGGGITTVALDAAIATRLQLTRQPVRHQSDTCASYTQTVDVRFGLTDSGCSMRDRASTIRALANPSLGADDFATPGHVAPLIAHRDGLSARRGHTEASIALMGLAAVPAVAMLCEVLDEQGNPARGQVLAHFASQHGIAICHIDDIAAATSAQSQFTAP